jgi:voltage-gated potassium channel
MRALRLVQRATDSLAELVAIYAAAILSAAALFSVLEHQGLFDSLYWAVTTALTIGYGDYSPHTVPGKVLAMVLMHFVTLFVIPLLVAHMATRVLNNKDAFTHGEQENIKKLLNKIGQKMGIK